MFFHLLSPLAKAVFQLSLAAAPLAPPAPPLVELDAILVDPSQYLGETVRTYLQVHSEVGDWNPYMLRFSPVGYRCLQVWTDQQMLWDAEDYEAPAARVFLPRFAASRIGRARPQERYLCTVVVHDWFAGRPWIEVQHAIRTRRHVPEGALLAAIRAAELAERGAFGLALGEFDRALAAPLPAAAAQRLAVAREACALSHGGESRPVEAQVRVPKPAPRD